MAEWWSLFKKELVMGKRTGVFSWIALLLILFIAGVELYYAYRFRSGVVSMIGVAFWLFLFFVPSVYMLLSLKRERDMTPLWLQLPLPSWMLLTTKYAAAIVEQWVSIIIVGGLFFWVYEVEKSGTNLISGFTDLEEIMTDLYSKGGIDVLTFLYGSVAMAIWIVLLYFIAAAWKNRLGGWSWPIVILLFAIVCLIRMWFESTQMFQYLFEWGYVNWAHIDFGFLNGAETNGKGNEIDLDYVGIVLWELILTAGALYMSMWLLDRKIEV